MHHNWSKAVSGWILTCYLYQFLNKLRVQLSRRKEQLTDAETWDSFRLKAQQVWLPPHPEPGFEEHCQGGCKLLILESVLWTLHKHRHAQSQSQTPTFFSNSSPKKRKKIQHVSSSPFLETWKFLTFLFMILIILFVLDILTFRGVYSSNYLSSICLMRKHNFYSFIWIQTSWVPQAKVTNSCSKSVLLFKNNPKNLLKIKGQIILLLISSLY